MLVLGGAETARDSCLCRNLSTADSGCGRTGCPLPNLTPLTFLLTSYDVLHRYASVFLECSSVYGTFHEFDAGPRPPGLGLRFPVRRASIRRARPL